MKKIYEIKKIQNNFYMYWTLTDFCNFRCNYCPDKLHSGDFAQARKPGFPTNDEIQTFIDKLISQHLRGRNLYLVIAGGEPTLHPMFESIIEQLTPYGFISVTTNGSRAFEWWSNLKVLPQHVNISLHPEYTKIDKVNDLAQFLLDNKIDLQFNLSCDPTHWDKIVALYEGLNENLRAYVIPKVLNHLESDRSTYDYTAEQKVWIKQCQTYHFQNKPLKNPGRLRLQSMLHYTDGSKQILADISELTMTNQHDFRGWSCSAGNTSINAHFDGNVWSSICKIVNLGRLESFELLEEPVICDRHYCTCPDDIVLDKKAPSS